MDEKCELPPSSSGQPADSCLAWIPPPYAANKEAIDAMWAAFGAAPYWLGNIGYNYSASKTAQPEADEPVIVEPNK